jgi:zeta-carotene isomerase
MASTPLVFSTFLSSKLYQTSHHHHHHHHLPPPLNFFPSLSSSKLKQSFHYFPSKPLLFSQKLIARAASEERATEVRDSDLVGEDSATFDLKNQKFSSWFYFTAILGVVLFVLNVIWIDDSTGFGTAFVDSISAISDSHEVIIYFTFFKFYFL